jgi:hypothetical protein
MKCQASLQLDDSRFNRFRHGIFPEMKSLPDNLLPRIRGRTPIDGGASFGYDYV